MTKREIPQCDSCEYVQISNNSDETDVRGMFVCKICKQDICEECKDEHALDHCGWND